MKSFVSFGVSALLSFLLLPVITQAQIIETKTTQNLKVDYKRLERIDTLINDYVTKNWLTGAVTLVLKDNQLVQYKGYGFADLETKKPMQKDAIFRIMSQTKAITSVGIMILYEQGKFLLDEPISNFIPEFKNPVVLDKYTASDTTYTTVPAKRNITFRDLLTHSSGIGYAAIGTSTANAIYAKAKIPSGLGYFNANLVERMRALAKLPLMFQPGEKWQYGLSDDVLGALIEVISGKTLEDFFSQNIFQPLGMYDTYFNLPPTKANRLASVYTEDSLHRITKWSSTFRQIDPNYPNMKKQYFSGGAGLSSTAFDYGIFLQMLLNKGVYGGHRILSPRSVELMTSNQLDFAYNGSDNFGLGFALTTAKSAAKNPRSEGSFSWGGYYGTTYWADPKRNLVCLIMTQHTPNSHGDLATKFEALVYSSLTE